MLSKNILDIVGTIVVHVIFIITFIKVLKFKKNSIRVKNSKYSSEINGILILIAFFAYISSVIALLYKDDYKVLVGMATTFILMSYSIVSNGKGQIEIQTKKQLIIQIIKYLIIPLLGLGVYYVTREKRVVIVTMCGYLLGVIVISGKYFFNKK